VNVPAHLLGLQLPRKGRHGHVESWFFKANDPAGRRALWLKTTVFARAARGVPALAEVWAIAFDRELGHVVTKSTVPLGAGRFAHGALDVEVDGCALSLGRARGAIATGWRRLGWDLTIGPERAAPIVHLPALAMYASARPPSSKIVTPLADARASGTVLVFRGSGNEERWDIDGWPCMIGHNWGRRHPHLYAWTHCNVWDGVEDLVFEAISARVRVGPVLSPMATAAFVRFRGKSFDLNAPSALTHNRGVVSLRRWELEAWHGAARVACEIKAETDELVGLHYENPSAEATYCLNTKLAKARIELHLPGGEIVIATSRGAAFEIGTRDPAHGVRMHA
jgi:hypothetical protein